MNARVPDRCENDRRRALKNARQRRYGVTHKGKAARRRDAMLQRYGITVQQYDKMFALQDGKCVGCGRPQRPGGSRSSTIINRSACAGSRAITATAT
jgi:hypothetical protein